MSVELGAALVGFIIAVTTLVKVITDKIKLTTERAETKKVRDADSQELHDRAQENSWEIKRIKEDVTVLKTHLDDHQLQLSVLNTELAKLGTKMDSVLDAIKDLKESK